MFERFKKWLGFEAIDDDVPPARASALNRSGAFARPAPSRPLPRGQVQVKPARPAESPAKPPEAARERPGGDRVVDLGPGKNVLVRNPYRREDTGTHEKLTIVDDSVVESGEETGIDPYNTGKFDRSRNWDKRFR